ncbi:MAG TPA: hypothetical protein DCG58_01740 [Hyphomonas adhaerens]|uniref:Uncharacterized protein n=1 Tax=Hyphomonas adhaerens TaxID=81029 RepID=A0A3B9GTS1_9PROT|nr:hypothetical protein [Hyphomonas sp.]HAE25855.1 hypothetical protein [Hyphomonas adhaerens]
MPARLRSRGERTAAHEDQPQRSALFRCDLQPPAFPEIRSVLKFDDDAGSRACTQRLLSRPEGFAAIETDSEDKSRRIEKDLHTGRGEAFDIA